MHFGEIPKGLLIDHINEIKSDDRIDNLRLATNSQNKINCGIRVDNKSGYRGVKKRKDSNRWEVALMINGKNTYLGLFEDIEAAVEAYKSKSKLIYGDFSK